jgi:hypothetical protein
MWGAVDCKVSIIDSGGVHRILTDERLAPCFNQNIDHHSGFGLEAPVTMMPPTSCLDIPGWSRQCINRQRGLNA